MAYAIVVGLVVLLGAGALLMSPTDPPGYRETALQSAQGSLSAVRVLALIGQADLDGRVLAPYVTVELGNVRESVATPLRNLSVEEVPDAESRALRDEVLPLLSEAVAVVGDTGMALQAHDRAGIARGVDQLNQVGDRLDDFIRTHG